MSRGDNEEKAIIYSLPRIFLNTLKVVTMCVKGWITPNFLV